MTKAQKKKIIATILKDRTAKSAKQYQPFKTVLKPKHSEKAQKLAEIIKDNDFGCRQETVRKLIGELIGEKLPTSGNHSSDIEFEPHKMLPFTCFNVKTDSWICENAVLISTDRDNTYLTLQDGEVCGVIAESLISFEYCSSSCIDTTILDDIMNLKILEDMLSPLIEVYDEYDMPVKK